MINFDPAIDRVCEILNCTPGEAPGIVAEMKEQLQTKPVSEPPNSNRDVFVLVNNRWRRIGYFHNNKWFTFGSSGLSIQYKVTHWWELPPMPKEEK